MALTAPNTLMTIRSVVSPESESEQTDFGTRACVSVSSCTSCCSCCCCCCCCRRWPAVPFCLPQPLFLADAAASPPTCCCCVGWLRLWLTQVEMVVFRSCVFNGLYLRWESVGCVSIEAVKNTKHTKQQCFGQFISAIC